MATADRGCVDRPCVSIRREGEYLVLVGTGYMVSIRETDQIFYDDTLQAPAKRWITFGASSHRANFERPSEYTALLTEVLADTTHP